MWFWKRKRHESGFKQIPGSKSYPKIELDTVGAWEVSRVADSIIFFPALLTLLPEHTTLFFESVSSEEITTYLRSVQIAKPTRVKTGSVWLDNDSYHIPLNAETMRQMVGFADHHCEVEIMQHLIAYNGDKVLLSWYDAWAAPLNVAPEIPEEVVRRFCEEVGSTYRISDI